MTPIEFLNTVDPKIILTAFLKTDTRAEHGCLNWTGTLATNGYGRLSLCGKRVPVHRAVWVMQNGPLDPQKDVCHSCDNRRCVNMTHLFVGSRSDNMLDASKKHRLHAQRSPATMPRGEQHGRSKLTWGDVGDIRSLARAKYSARRLSQMYGVCQTTISRIVSGKTWAIRSLKEK